MNRVFLADEAVINRIIKSFDREHFVTPPQYALYCIQYDDCSITIYNSRKVVFQGKNAAIYAASFFPEKSVVLPQAGSDEVGTGDYFGPVCVCGCYLDDDSYRQIEHLNIIDSKQLTDPQIIEIAKQLVRHVPYSLLILNNAKYNQLQSENNLNQIKAKMHNKCYLNLRNKGIILPDLLVIDDFCGEEKFYQYLQGEAEIIRNFSFETKAENKYVSVACGALIARYAFLESLQAMNRQYGCQFPKGAGPAVDEFAAYFVRKHGWQELRNVAKMNFKNTQKIEAIK